MAQSLPNSQKEGLRRHFEQYLQRLLLQLNDMEELRNLMDDDEYYEMKRETYERLIDTNERLRECTYSKVNVYKMSPLRMATIAAITKAFKTLSIIKMFAENEPDLLRDKLSQIERNLKSNEFNPELCRRQKLEALTALRHLGCEITESEKMFVRKEGSQILNNTFSEATNIRSDCLYGFDIETFFKIDDDTA